MNICYICGGAMRFLFDKNGHKFWRCMKCGLECIYPQPDNDILDKIYGEHYYDAWGLKQSELIVKKMKQQTFLRHLDELLRLRSTGALGRLLDCGAATGYLVELTKQLGWDSYAVELSEFGANACTRIIGDDHVYNGQLQDAYFNANPSGNFEAIIMFDFIEHVREPKILFEWARDHLTSKGYLVIITPYVGSLSWLLMKQRWTHYKLEHLWYFSPHAIRKLLEDTGFTIKNIKPAKKSITLEYAFSQFKVYPHPKITPFTTFIKSVLPAHIQRYPISLSLGDMLVYATKKL